MSAEGKSVAIVAMGASCRDYLMEAAQINARGQIADEVWAINAMADVIQHDRAIIMDDLRVFVWRAEHVMKKPWYTEWMKRHDKPIYTSVDYPEFPTSVAYPLAEVVNDIGNPHYWNNTVAYAVGLAIYEKARAIKIYGADYTYPDHHQSESGRGCVEFLLGVAHARGIQIDTANSTTLLDTQVPEAHKFYGYIHQPMVRAEEDRFALTLMGGVEYDEIQDVEVKYGRYALKKAG